MSKLDKEQVLADYAEAYAKAHGKAPNVEENGGWYSVDGGKKVRLAQLAEDTVTLGSAKAAPKKAAAVKKSTPEAPKKAAKKQSAANASADTKKSGAGSGGLTAKELWKQRLAAQSSSRLPRGMQS